MTTSDEQGTLGEETTAIAESLISWVEEELDTEPDNQLQALLLLEKAEALQGLGKVRTALTDLVNAVNADRRLLPAIWILIHLLVRHKSWKNVIRLLNAEQKAAQSPAERAAAAYSWGSFREDRLEDLDGAIASFKEALEAVPDDGAALVALERAAVLAGDLGLLAESLEKQVELSQDQRRRALLLIDLARLQPSLGDGSEDQAFEYLRKAAATEPERWHWLTLLERHAEKTDQQQVRAEALEGRAKIMAAKADVETAGEAAEAGAPWVHQPAEAAAYAASLWRRAAIVREPADPQAAVEDLRRCAELVPGDEVASFELFALLMRQGRKEEALELARSRIEARSGGPEAALWHIRAAEIEAGEGEATRAVEHFRAALEAYPTSLMAHSGAEELLAAHGQWDELAAIYKLTAEAVEPKDPELGASLLIRAAELSDRYLSDPERALSLLSRAGESTHYTEVADRMRASILCRLERWDEAITALEGIASRLDDRTSIVLILDEIANIQRLHLRDSARAAATSERILEHEAGASWVLEVLAELYAELKRWPELARTYRQMADLPSEPDERSAAYLAVAGWVLQCHGNAPEEAEKHYRQALERSGDNALAQAGLEELAWQQGESAGLRKLLRGRAEAALDPGEIERLLLTVGLDCESAGDVEEAIAVYQELLDRVPGARSARWGLARCHRRLARWTEYAEVLGAELDRVGAEEDRGALFLELAEVFLDRLGQVAQGEDALRRALDVAPDLLPAVLLLADCERLNAAWADLDTLLLKLLELAPESALLVAEERLGLFAGPAQNEEAAQDTYEVLLQNIPRHRVALFWQALVAAANGEAEARLRSWSRLAQIEGNDGAGAQLRAQARTISRVNEIEDELPVELPEGEPPAPLVISLCDEDEIPPEQSEAVLRARRELTADGAARTFWSLELAAALEERSQFDKARDIYTEVLERSAGHIGALEGLARVTAALERWEEHASVTEELAGIYTEPKVAATMWAEVAAARVALGDSERAEEASRKALELDPTHRAAFARHLSLLRERGDLPALNELIESRVGQVDDPAELTRLLLAQAGLFREQGDLDASSSSLETALLVDGANRDALRARAAFDVADGRWYAAVSSLVEWAEHADEETRRTSLWRAAEVALEKHDDAPRAVKVLLPLAGVDDRDPDTYRRLAQAARQAGDWDEAVRALAKLVELTPDPEERLEALRAEGTIRQHLIGDPAGAGRTWEQVVHLRPQDVQAITSLIEVVGEERKAPVIASLTQGVAGVMAQSPIDAEALRALYTLRRAAGDPDGALCVLRVLDALGAASAEEQEQLQVLLSQAPQEPARPLSPGALEAIKHPAQTGPAEQLHQLLLPILPKVFAADVTALRLGRPVKDRGGDLLLDRVRSAGEVFGTANLVLRRSEDPAVTLAPVQATEPTIAAGPSQTGHLTAGDRFVLGRACWHARAGTAFLANRADTHVRALHDAATKEGFRGFQPSEVRLGVDALQREIHRHLPRKLRRPLAEIATQMARASEASLQGWCRASKASADRAGLLLSGDVAAALATLVPGWRGADPAQRASSRSRVQSHDAARDLLVFAVSNEYLALRREVGLATQSW